MDTQVQVVSYVAVDVSKNTLEVLEPTKAKSYPIPNTEKALKRLLKTVCQLPKLHFICEATGGYERTLVDFLHTREITVSIVSPARVRHFAHSEGIKAKSDPIDARMLMRFAKEKRPRPTPAPSKARAELVELMDRREHLSEQLKREKTRLQKCGKSVAGSIERMIAIIEQEIALLEERIGKVVDSEPCFTEIYKQLIAVTGIGPVTAWTLLAYLPELGLLSRNEVVALAGLAPYNQESGSSKKLRKIFGGRAKVRRCLYLAAVTAWQHNPVIKHYTNEIIKRNKPFKWAIVAAMRKLLVHAHYLAKNRVYALA